MIDDSLRRRFRQSGRSFPRERWRRCAMRSARRPRRAAGGARRARSIGSMQPMEIGYYDNLIVVPERAYVPQELETAARVGYRRAALLSALGAQRRHRRFRRSCAARFDGRPTRRVDGRAQPLARVALEQSVGGKPVRAAQSTLPQRPLHRCASRGGGIRRLARRLRHGRVARRSARRVSRRRSV